MTGRYPLTWPEGWPRTRYPDPAGNKFGDNNTVYKASNGLYHNLALMGVEDIQLSSDMQLRLDGMPRSGQRMPDDAGVAVYFTRAGEKLVIACDLYMHIEDNIRAIALIVESMRRIERYGGDKMMKRAFTGFTAIEGPDAIRKEDWWQVLGVPPHSDREAAETSYRNLARKAHPDAGGSDAAMARLNKAIQEARTR